MTPEKFREIQTQADMTFKDLSFYTGITTAMIRNYAAGDNEIPEFVVLMMEEIEEEL